jgi:hypothetical protein
MISNIKGLPHIARHVIHTRLSLPHIARHVIHTRLSLPHIASHVIHTRLSLPHIARHVIDTRFEPSCPECNGILLLAPGPSTIRNPRFWGDVPDLATNVDRPTGRSLALHELITP